MFTECKETLTQEPFPHRDRYTVYILLFAFMHILRDFNIKHTRKFRLTVFLFRLFADAHIHKSTRVSKNDERGEERKTRKKLLEIS